MEGEQPVERDYYGKEIKNPFVLQQRREKRERMASMSDAQKAAMAAGVEATRTEPVTDEGKALKACGLAWLEADFEAEAEQRGVPVEQVEGYAPSMAEARAASERADSVRSATEAVSAMRHEDMEKVYRAMLDHGFDPSEGRSE